MSRVIAIANQKGGVGKTTTSINLSACLAEKGKKVLLIDMDSQGNTTSGFGFEKNELDKTVYEVLREEVSIEEAIIPVEECFENLFLIPANRNLAGAEIELVTRENMQYILKKQLEPIKDNYDFIIIDCPPALGMLTVNAMTASDSVLVPIQCEFYALDGLSQLIYTIELIQDSLNPDLYIEGVVFTMYDARTNLSLQVVENVKRFVQYQFDIVIVVNLVYYPDSNYHFYFCLKVLELRLFYYLLILYNLYSCLNFLIH